MNELVKRSFDFLEYLIVGAIVLGSMAVLSRRIRLSVLKHFNKKESSQEKQRLFQGAIVSVLVAAAYFIGAIFNSVSYAFLQPAHIKLVSAVEQQQNHINGAKRPDATDLREPLSRLNSISFYLTPLLFLGAPSADDYLNYYTNDLRDLTWWKTGQQIPEESYPVGYTHHIEYMTNLNRHSRMARSGILIALLWAATAVCGFIVIWCNGRNGDVDSKNSKRWPWSNLVQRRILIGAVLSYFCTMAAFKSLEIEYHTRVYWQVPDQGLHLMNLTTTNNTTCNNGELTLRLLLHLTNSTAANSIEMNTSAAQTHVGFH